MFLHICTVGLGPKISALQVGVVENFKFNDDLAIFFEIFFAKSYTVQFNTSTFRLSTYFILLELKKVVTSWHREV